MRNSLIYFVGIDANVPFGVGATFGLGGVKGEGLVLGFVGAGFVSGIFQRVL